MSNQGDSEGQRDVRVWDLPVRVFHWALVVLVALSFATGEFGGFDFTNPLNGNMVANMTLHMWSGLTILSLLLFRVIWGFIGSSTARFSDFAAGPGAILSYVGGMFRKSGKFIAGHNPAGGLVVILLLALLLGQACTGLFSKEDDFFGIAGPLNGQVSEDTAKSLTRLHHRIWGYLELLIIVHILANIFYWLVLKQNLVVAMFTGRKPIAPGTAAPALRFAPTATALAAYAVAAALVWSITLVG